MGEEELAILLNGVDLSQGLRDLRDPTCIAKS